MDLHESLHNVSLGISVRLAECQGGAVLPKETGEVVAAAGSEAKVAGSGSRGQLSAQRRHKAKLLAAGLCVKCRQPKNTSTTRCKPCTDRAVAVNRATKAAARASGYCAECRAPWRGLTKRCPACIRQSRAKWNARAGSDYCARCAGPRDSNHKACAKCRALMREASTRRRSEFQAAGCCVQCGAVRDASSAYYCRKHILKLAAYRWLDDVTRWRELDALWSAQEGRCAYTGEQLELGGNASIDHRVPRSRGGANDIGNLQWVSWVVNRAKSALSHDEFLVMCAAVTARQYRQPAVLERAS